MRSVWAALLALAALPAVVTLATEYGHKPRPQECTKAAPWPIASTTRRDI